MIDFLVWFGLGWSFGNWVGNLLKQSAELKDLIFTFSTQMFALLCVLIGLFA